MLVAQRTRQTIRNLFRPRRCPPEEAESEEAKVVASGCIFAEFCFCFLTTVTGESHDLFKDMISCTEVLAAVAGSLLAIGFTSRSFQVQALMWLSIVRTRLLLQASLLNQANSLVVLSLTGFFIVDRPGHKATFIVGFISQYCYLFRLCNQLNFVSIVSSALCGLFIAFRTHKKLKYLIDKDKEKVLKP